VNLIQKSPRFKKDSDRYLKAIHAMEESDLKKEAKSLYDQFISTVKQLDQSFEFLVTERLINNTQTADLNVKLQNLRAQLEKKIAK
jgi:hypothetical protein